MSLTLRKETRNDHNMAGAPEIRESLLQKAMDKQQEYYELLADWLVYTPNQEDYCKQNIGFALYGPPTSANEPADDNLDINIINLIKFTPEEKKLIDKIYNLINTYGKIICVKEVTIWIGILYNLTLPTEVQMKKSQGNHFLASFPIFKIKNTKNGIYNIWYIDHTGRIYKSWMDYLKTNTLPECTMVVPKDGMLQSMTEYITKENSRVWLDLLDSPACLMKNKVLKKLDIATSVTGLTAGIGLAATSFIMPVAPVVVLGALGVNFLTGAWAFGRSAHKLRDRSEHEESIGLNNMEAASAWLGIAGSTFGVAAGGGSAILSKAAEQGRNISTAAKIAYNSSLVCSLGVNGVGTLFQCYNMYENYKINGKVDFVDVVSFAAHLLFFANSVVKVQFAKDVILSSQGKVIEEYRSGLSKARHRNAYNRMVRKIGENNSDPVSKSTEIVRRINMKGSTRNVVTPNTTVGSACNTTKFSIHQFQLQWDLNAIIIKGFKIISPKLFIKYILERMQSDSEEISEEYNDSELNSTINDVSDMIDLNFNPRETGNVPTEKNIQLMLCATTSNQDVLKIVRNLLKMTFHIVTRNGDISGYFTDLLRLLFKYLRINAWKHSQTLCNRIENCTLRKMMSKISEIILDGMKILEDEILEAMHCFMKLKEDQFRKTVIRCML